MPLNPKDEVRRRAFRGQASLNGLDNCILWAAGRDAEAVAGDADRLMVAGVDGKPEEEVLLWGLGGGEEAAKEGLGSDCSGMSDRDTAASGMVHRENGQILNQRATTPDVEELDAEADSEDRLIEVVGVLDEKLIDIFAKTIGRGALGYRLLAVFVGVHVGRTTREQDPLAGIDEVGDGRWGGNKGDFDRLAAAALNGRGVLRPRTLVVGKIGAGRDGDS